MSTTLNNISDKQLAANRANATRSTGPTSPRGKSASSRNATSHGLCSAHLVLFAWESQEELNTLAASFHARFRPLDQAETQLVNRLVDCTWRRNRIIAIETTLMDLDISEYEPEFVERFPQEEEDGVLRMALVFRAKHGEHSSLALQRYLTSVERSYSRARRELELLQKERYNSLSAEEIVEASLEVEAMDHSITERTHFQPQEQPALRLVQPDRKETNGNEPKPNHPER